MVQWVELVTKQFNACQEACVWFLEHMAQDVWWPVQVLLKCPNQMVRQMFQRLCIHVIQRLKYVLWLSFIEYNNIVLNIFRQSHSSLYLRIDEGVDLSKVEDTQNIDVSKIGNASCVTKFIKTLLSLVRISSRFEITTSSNRLFWFCRWNTARKLT